MCQCLYIYIYIVKETGSWWLNCPKERSPANWTIRQYLFSTSLSLVGSLYSLSFVGSPHSGRHSSRKSSATYSYQCQYFWYVQTMVCLPTLGIFSLLTDVDACDFTREHWKFTPGEKSLAAPGTRTRVSIAPGFSFGHSTNWAILPIMYRFFSRCFVFIDESLLQVGQPVGLAIHYLSLCVLLFGLVAESRFCFYLTLFALSSTSPWTLPGNAYNLLFDVITSSTTCTSFLCLFQQPCARTTPPSQSTGWTAQRWLGRTPSSATTRQSSPFAASPVKPWLLGS